MTSKDTLGVAVEVGDTVTVTSYGEGRVTRMDVGCRFVVTGFTPRGNLRHETDLASGTAIPPLLVAVKRRDGSRGHEGNKPRQTRVIQDPFNGDRWQKQYYDPDKKLWFDIGDAKATKEEAEATP